MNTATAENKQFATFYLGKRLFGIDVMQVQEVTQALGITPIRLAPSYVRGLINLRGQIATAIGLQDLFDLPPEECVESSASVVCRIDGNLLSLLVGKIGEVIEVSNASFEHTPDTVDGEIRKFIEGVYKTDGSILSVIDVEALSRELNEKS